jgi:hypothetical protein
MKEFFVYWWERFTGIDTIRSEMANVQGRLNASLVESTRAKVLLSTAALRSVPKTMNEIIGGSNQSTGNVCYIHPKALRNVSGISMGIYSCGLQPFKALIVSTDLMPEFGVIFAPLHPAFFSPGEMAEFSKDWKTCLRA